MLTLMIESFPPESRLTSISIGYNVAQAIIGGMTPSLATLLVDKVGLISPGFYVSIICGLSLVGLYMMPESRYSEGPNKSSSVGRKGSRRDSDQKGLLNNDGELKERSLEMTRISEDRSRIGSV